MKIKRNLIPFCLVVTLLLALACSATAQTFSLIHSFDKSSPVQFEGTIPETGLTVADNVLYGTTFLGFSNSLYGYLGYGTIFKMNPDGSGYAVLTNFADSDDAPAGTLTVSGNVIYGAAMGNARFTEGRLFKINTDGGEFTLLKSFTGPDGGVPATRLALSGNTLYGTTREGGDEGSGSIFSLTVPPAGYNQLSGQLLSPGKMRLSYVGLSRRPYYPDSYVLDRTASLSPATWVPQATNATDANGNLVFTNTLNPATNNFWRVRTGP